METEFSPSIPLGKTGCVIQQSNPYWREVLKEMSLHLQKQTKNIYKDRRKNSKQGYSQLIVDSWSYTKIENGTRQNLPQG